MKQIKVEKLLYDTASGAGIINISDNDGGNSVLNIDFKPLLPFANLVNKEILDFFTISASVYGIDRFVARKQNSVDGWSRELKVSFPVHDIAKWNANKDHLNKLLSFLTGDYWDVSFRIGNLQLPHKDLDHEYLVSFEQVNLLSGGLDSLIGALDFLKSTNGKVLFVSHYDKQMHGPKGDQKGIILEMEEMYPDRFVHIPSIRVTMDSTNMTKETTFRSRSLLFIGLALLAAQATDTSCIIVPENGSVSLNYPLSASRRTSCSTRTTHPFVIETVLSIWNTLSITTSIHNPYEFKTKGEMVTSCEDQTNLVNLVTLSNSCGKRGHRAHWEEPTATHCGICMPCVYRQASLTTISDETSYGNSINSLAPFLKKKTQDVGACLDFLNRELTKEDIKQELIVNGVKNLSKLYEYVDVVWRTREELRRWVNITGDDEVKLKAGLND